MSARAVRSRLVGIMRALRGAKRSGADTAPPLRVGFGAHGNWPEYIRQHLDARYAPSFVDLAQADIDDFDVVVPVQIEHYQPLARLPALRGRKFLHPSAEVVALCDDKLKLNEFLVGEGFGNLVPPLRDFGAPYPYVRKKRQGWYGLHCQIVQSADDEQTLDLSDNAWFAQGYVPGEIECATHILRVGGRIRYASTFTYTMAAAALVKGQHHAPVSTAFAPGCSYLDCFTEMLEALEFEGTACVDYRVVSGQPVLFEINPRFGGSLCTDVTAYLDAYITALDRG
jgi:predicted ATP-grasp superfamily ATP-dependent carboligase